MTEPAPWTTAADVRARLTRLWDQGRFLAARVTGEPLFPLAVPLRKPTTRELGERFDDVRRWIRALTESSKDTRGVGFEIAWESINHRQLGANRVPASLCVPSERDALALIDKARDAERFARLSGVTLEAFPALRPWLARRPLAVLEEAAHWPRVLAVLTWLARHPRPGLYLRQLEIPDVDSKFIEMHKRLLSELLDVVLPVTAIDADAVGMAAFEARYGLRTKPATLRFRVLDPTQLIVGLSDLTVTVAELSRLPPVATNVFITENEINGLAFPPVENAIVVFGLGYGLERLGELPWLAGRSIHYWGDIDTHGFAILDRLRARFPAARSFLMDRETLLAHKLLWGREGESERHTGALARLTPAEAALYEDLRDDRVGPRVRLEQERISFTWLRAALERP